jgi:DNA-binding IclR family transcriptional regulator
MEQTPQPKIKSLGVAFDIVDVLHASGGATLTEVAEEMDKPVSTVNDYLQTLQELRCVRNDDGTYRVGMRFLEHGGRRRARTRIFRMAEQEVRALANDTGEHANLMIEENGLGVFLLKEKGADAVVLDNYEGMSVHLHTTALGKSILAYMDEERVDEIIEQRGLPKLTENTISDEATLRQELATIRERGYAIDDEERLEDIRCVAAPVTMGGQNVAGAISISAPKNRMRGEYFEETIPEKVLQTANIITVNYRHG